MLIRKVRAKNPQLLIATTVEKEPSNFVEFTKKLIKKINKSQDDRFDFPTNENVIKHLKSTTLYSMASYSGTPLIKDSKEYDHTLGLIDE